MSDAVNCLVYVSSPIDVDPVKEAEGVLREIEESGNLFLKTKHINKASIEKYNLHRV
jgi:hypothetical protein